MFNNKEINAIGINISDLSIRFVLLENKKSQIKIKAFGKYQLKEGIVNNGEILNTDNFKEAIFKMLDKPKFGTVNSNKVILSLPETKTFIKLIYIDKSPNNLKNLIETEIEKQIPIKVENYYYDWQIIKENKNDYKILVGLAPKKIVDQYINVFKELKMSVIAMEIESLSICRALLPEERPNFHKKQLKLIKSQKNKEKNKENKTYGIIDIGASRSNMTIYSQNSIVLSISIPISGKSITKEIAENLEIKEDQAEKAKIVCGLDKKKAQGVVAEILSNSIKKLIQKINKIIDFYNSEHPELDNINQLILTGGGANIKKLDEIIEKESKIQTILGDPFANLHKNTEIDKALNEVHKINTKFLKTKKQKTISLNQNNAQEFTIAIGLALRSIFICKN